MKSNDILKKISDKYVIEIHFRNPYMYNGGADTIVANHVDEMDTLGLTSFVLFPITKKVGKIQISAWGIVIARKFLGTYSTFEIIRILNLINSEKSCLAIFIHSLIYMELDELYKIIAFRNEIIVYLHDYALCCVQYNLLKNDMYYCGNAKLYFEKCYDCKYYFSAIKKKEQYRQFFGRIKNLVFVAPSNSIAQEWSEAYPEFCKNVCVIGHKNLIGKNNQNLSILSENEKINLAFVGKPIKIKGYECYEKAIHDIHNQEDYNFYNFCDKVVKDELINTIKVATYRDGYEAMTRVLLENKIHVAILFSVCPETYSLTYYECMAANAFIVTNNISGNIAVATRDNGNGIIIEPSSKALVELLENSSSLRSKINTYRRSGIKGPQRLMTNRAFFDFLKEEEQIKISFEGRKKVVVARIVELLYRLRYKLF